MSVHEVASLAIACLPECCWTRWALAVCDSGGSGVQIHDELLFLVRKECLSKAVGVIRSTLEAAVQGGDMWSLTVPLPVKISVGPSWGELEEYDENQFRDK